jgi:hypothetical protein
MPEATDDNIPTHIAVKFSQHEVDALADRLFGRVVSMLFDVQPELRRDILSAVACLRVLARDMPDEITVRIWRAQ